MSPRLSFDQLQIDGFGHFHELKLELGPKLNVLYGDNGVGKSTLMAFVRSVLFGFARRNTPERYEVQGGKSFGGRVLLSTPHGELWVQRLAGKRVEGDLTVKNGVMAAVPESRLREALASIDRELFEQVFTFGIDELRSWAQLMDAGKVKDALAAATMQGAQQLPFALEKLDAEARQLWGRQATTRPLNVVLEALSRVRARRQQLGDRPKEYFAARTLREQTVHAAAALELRLDAVAKEEFRLDRLRAAAPDVDRAVLAQGRLRALPAADRFPEGGLGRLDDAELARASARAARARAAAHRDGHAARLERLTAQLQARPPAPPVAAAVDAWQQVAQADAALDERRAAFALKEKRLAEATLRLGLPRGLLGVDASAAARAALSGHRARCDDAGRKAAAADQALAQAVGRHEEAQRERARLEAELTALGDGGAPVAQALEAARAIGLLEHELRVVTAQVEDRQTALAAAQVPDEPAPVPRWPRWLVAAVTLALLAASGAVFALSGAGAGVLALAVSAAVAGLLVTLHRHDQTHWLAAQSAHLAVTRHRHDHRARLGAELSAARARLTALDAQLAGLRAAAGVGAGEAASARLAELERHAGLAGRRAELTRDVALGRARAASADAECGQARVAAKAAAAELTAVRGALAAELEALGLPPTLDPSAALELLGEVGHAHAAARALEDESAALGADAQRVAVAGEALAHAVKAAQVAGATAAEQVAALRAWLAQTLALQAEAGAVRAHAADAAHAVAAAEADEAQAEQRVAALLEAAGATDPEDFRRRGAAGEAHAAAAREASQAAARVHAACGLDVAAAHAELLAAPGLDARWAAVREERAALEGERRALLERRGALGQQLAAWEADADVAPLLQEEQRLAAQAEALARRFAVARLGHAVLVQAREKFEAEHQPLVVSRAAQLLARLTAGAYPKLVFSTPGGVLEAFDRQGRAFTVEQLSRGTRELLLTALRVAMVEDFGRDRLALPLMVDDALVNFDPRRAQAMVEVLAELSQRHQVLAFTCHPQTRELFKEYGAQAIEVSTRTQLQLLPS